MNDEDIPYRTPGINYQLPAEAQVSSLDERNYDTLKMVLHTLTTAVDSLDKWHAFDTTCTELQVKQQIVAHRIAADILSPVIEAVKSSVEAVDNKYRQQ